MKSVDRVNEIERQLRYLQATERFKGILFAVDEDKKIEELMNDTGLNREEAEKVFNEVKKALLQVAKGK